MKKYPQKTVFTTQLTQDFESRLNHLSKRAHLSFERFGLSQNTKFKDTRFKDAFLRASLR